MTPLSTQHSLLITDPLWLLALPGIAAFLVMARWPWWRAAIRAGRLALRQEAIRLALRLLWVSLPVLALSGVVLTRSLDRQAHIFVLDASASVAPARDHAEGVVRTVATRLREGDLLGVVGVAASAGVEEPPSSQPLFRGLASSLADSASDLASGLRLAGALLPEGFVGRVVLVSDGRQTQGDAVAAARELGARGIIVDVMAVGADAAADLRMESVELSQTAYQGETTTLAARVHADSAAQATLRVYRDDRLLLERQAKLQGGRQEVAVTVPVGEAGLHRYRVELSSPDPSTDANPANNALGALQRVMGPPRILVIAQGGESGGFLPGLLRAGGAEVTVVPPAGVPAELAGWARYDAAVLVDVPAESLPSGAMEQMEGFVRDLGRGLAMTGGPDSFGPGGYADTPVERALPVYMDLRGRGRRPRVALALVIDKSGSMSGIKMEMAKEAAARSLRTLRVGDQAALLAFDSIPQWVAPLTPVSEMERLEEAIGSIYAAGGTEVYPAISAAVAALRGVESDVKHVILLTDGQSGSGGDYGTLIREMREDRISLSSVAVGEDADAALLEAMARAGRGRYHFTANPEDIPQIFTMETLMATRTLLVDQRFYPAAASAGPILRGIGPVPPLDGYVATTPKEQAEVVLLSPEGDPVLAAWQFGLGRAAAWTPDVEGRWSAAWAGSPASALLWGNLLSWLLPAQDAGELVVRAEAEDAGTMVVLAENRGDWEEVRPTSATILGPDGQSMDLDLSPAGPGRYQGQTAMLPPGAYVVQVRQTLEGGGELRGEGGWVAPYPAEYRETGVDRALLARVASAGGGRVLDAADQLPSSAPRTAVAGWPAWPLLLLLAALLWPLEIASRRFLMPAAAQWWQALARKRSNAGTKLNRPDGSVGSGEETGSHKSPAPLATRTTERLLERKRALRDRR